MKRREQNWKSLTIEEKEDVEEPDDLIEWWGTFGHAECVMVKFVNDDYIIAV